MFEAQVAYYLNRYLGKYLVGLETESLKISVWKGDVELRNLHLKPEALADLDLPITVKAGLLGKLTLKVPWARLGREPVVVEFDRLYILAGPRSEADQQAGQQQHPSAYAHDVEVADQEAKRKRVEAAEAEWVAEMEARQQADEKVQGGASGGAASGRLSSLIEPILGNLQLVLTNVHVRFEDEGTAWPGHAMAAGVVLRRVAAHTVDENGRPAFVTAGVLDVLRKAMSLAQLGVYFDVERPLMSLPRNVSSWSALTPQQWDDLFSPGLHMPASTADGGDRMFLGQPLQSGGGFGLGPGAGSVQGVGGGGGGRAGRSLATHSPHMPALGSMIYEHDFLLVPISGGLRYTRRSAKTMAALRSTAGRHGTAEVAAQEWGLSLGDVAVQLSASQYAGAQALAEALDAAVTAAPHRHLRPRFRPTDASSVRAWWTYAFLISTRQLARGRLSWAALARAAALRKSYVAAYARWLEEGKPVSGEREISAMDAQLEAGAIIRFRRLAYAKVDARRGPGRLKSSSLATTSTRGALGPANTWSAWLGWRSRAPTPGGPGADNGAGEGEDGGRLAMRSGLSEDEWRRLEELLEEQQSASAEEAAAAGSDNPHTLGMQTSISIESLALVLLTSTAVTAKSVSAAAATSHHPAAHPSQGQSISGAGVWYAQGGTHARTVVDASMQRLVIQLRHYPRTLGISLRVGAAGVDSPQGRLFSTGLISSQQAQEGMAGIGAATGKGAAGPAGLDQGWLQPLHLNLPSIHAGEDSLSSGGAAASGGSTAPSLPEVGAGTGGPGASCALALDFVKSPQDGSADAVLHLLIAPSYVTYVPSAFGAVSDFFTGPGAGAPRELVALQARAAAQADALRKLAALRLRALSLARDKPKLLLQAVAHAPKVAITNASSTTVLLLDLGRLTLRSSRELALSLPDEEAALYECLAVQLDHVAAHIADEVPRGASLSRTRKLRSSRNHHTGSMGQHGSGHTAFVWPTRPVGPAGSPVGAGAAGAGAGGVEEDAWGVPQLLEYGAAAGGPLWRLTPLMERFVVEARVQVATSVHPKFPQLRMFLDASPLRLHISPACLHRIMHVIAAVTTPSTAPPTADTGGTKALARASSGRPGTQLPLWITDAEFTSKVHALSWEGLAVAGTRRAHWLARHLRVWRGRVHLTRDEDDTAPLLTKAYWQPGWRLVDIPPGTQGLSLATSAHCVALIPPGGPEGASLSELATQPDTLVLRAPTALAHSALHLALARSRATMVSVSGLGLLAEEGVGEDGGEGSAAGAGEEEVDVLVNLLRHKQLLELRVTLSELSVQISGRPPTFTLPGAPAADPFAEGGRGEERGDVARRGLEEEASFDEGGQASGSSAGNGRQGGARGRPTSSPGGTPGTGQGPSGGRDYGWSSITTAALAAAAAASATAVQGLGEVAERTGRARGLAALTELVDPEELRRATLASELAEAEAQAAVEPAGENSDGADEEGGHAWGPPRLMGLDAEVPLLLARFRAAVVDFVYGSESMHLGAAMRALEIDDLLLGPSDPSMLPLARSGGHEAHDTAIASAAGAVAAHAGDGEKAPGDATDEDEAFFDAQASWLVPPRGYAQHGADGEGSSASALGSDAQEDWGHGHAGHTQHPQHLVWLSFTSWDRNHPKRPGTDSELRARLSRLIFRVHRPTVAALMALGLDMALATSAVPVAPNTASGTCGNGTQGGNGGESDNESDAGSVAGDNVQPVVLAVGAGAENRVVIRLVLEMESLELVLPYEGSGYTALASASMESFCMTLESRVAGLSLNARLGNIQADYEALPLSCKHRTICALRPGGPPDGSLVDVTFRIHAPEEIAAERRVPSHIRTMYSLEARVSAVQLVFMQRFINELTEFMLVMVAMQPPALPPLAGGAMGTGPCPAAAASHSSSTPTPTPPPPGDPLVLLLDVKAAAPLIVLPQNSTSSTSLELDLGSATVSNVLVYRPVSCPVGARVARMQPPHRFAALMDHIQVHLSGLGMVVVGPGGVRGKNLVAGSEKGLSADISVARPVALVVLQDTGSGAPIVARPRRHGPLPYLPPIHARVEVPEVSITLSDAEYRTTLVILASNFAEPVLLAPALGAFNAAVLARQQQQEEERDQVADDVREPYHQVQATAHDLQAPAPGAQPGPHGPTPDAATGAGSTGGGAKHGSHGSGSGSAGEGPRGPPTGWDDFGKTSGEVLGVIGDRCAVMACVLLRRASVTLTAQEPGAGDPTPQPLACISVADMWLSFVGGAASGAQLLTLVVPTLALQDIRPGAAPEAALVLSTADPVSGKAPATSPLLGLQRAPKSGGVAAAASALMAQRQLHKLKSMEEEWDGAITPSLLALEFRSVPCRGLARAATISPIIQPTTPPPPLPPPPANATGTEPSLQAIKLRLQKPTLVLDLAFLIQLSAFVAPQPGGGSLLGGAAPQPFATRELALGAVPHVATGDLWLSPEYRLLADAPDVSHFVYDGAGHRLVLPRGLPSGEALPLILVGPGKTLRLRNTVVVHSTSLGVCLQLGAGGRLLAREEDGCRLVATSRLEEEYASYLTEHVAGHSGGDGATTPRANSPVHRNMSSRMRAPSLARTSTHSPFSRASRIPGASQAVVQPLLSVLEVQVDATGVALHILDCPAVDTAAGVGAPSGLGPGAAALRWQGSAGAMDSPMKSAASLSSLAGAASMGRIKSESAGLRVQPTTRMLRRLALLLDASVLYKATGLSQAVQASLRGLSVRTMSTLVTAGYTSAPAPHPLPTSSADTQAGGLPRLKTTSFSGTAHSVAAAERLGRIGGTSDTSSSSTVTCTVLEPCDITLSVSMTEPPAGSGAHEQAAGRAGPADGAGAAEGEEEGQSAAPRMDVSLDVSDVVLKLSPDVLQLIIMLQTRVSQPLIVPPADKPLLRCDKFESLWSSRTGGVWGAAGSSATLGSSVGDAPLPQRAATNGSHGGVDPVARLRGLALWRPQAPQGYAVLGDVAVPGTGAQPTAPVAVLAINSGLVAWPVGYECCWSGAEGLALWRPLAPPGYVAMGCVASSGPHEPPPGKLCVCVAEHAVVEARAGACMLLCAAGNLWGVANCASTLVVAQPDSHLPVQPFRDLRSPLGVPPAALVKDVPPPTSGVPPPPSLLAQKRYLAARAALLGQAVAQRSTATTVEFRRLWWDKHSSASPSPMRVSFWRPVPPPGYVALADCMVTGIYAPPQGALVMADLDPGGALQSQLHGTSGKPPLLARPIGYTMVWMDRHRQQGGDTRHLVIWHPVAPQGYCALGCVVGRGPLQPPTGIIRCVRVDAAFSVGLSRGAPAWVNPPHRQRTALCGWIVDERLSSFVAVPQDDPLLKPPPTAPTGMRGVGASGAVAPGAPQRRLEGWRIKLDDDGEALGTPTPAAGAGPGQRSGAAGAAASTSSMAPGGGRQLSLEVRAGRMAVVLRSCARVPLLEVGASGVRLGCGSHGPAVTRGFVFATASVWSYQPLLAAWEPVLEPWQLLLHVDHNGGHRQRSGVGPGLWLKVTSTQGSVQTTLSQAALTSLLGAADEWAGALAPAGATSTVHSGTPLAQLGDGRAVVAEVYNTLGVKAEMLIDHGDRQEVVALLPGERRRIMQPLPMPPPGPLSAGDMSAFEGGGVGKGSAGGAGSAPAPALPPLRLLVDVLSARIAPEALAHLAPLTGATGCELLCRIRVGGCAAALLPPQAWGLSTRALLPGPSTSHGVSSGYCVLPWRERFVLQLPQELVEQLLLPAPGDNQFAGNPLELSLEIVAPALEAATWSQPGSGDAAGDAGDARTLALTAHGEVPVGFDWMANQASLLHLSTSKGTAHTRHSGVAAGVGDAAAASQRASLMLHVPLHHGQQGGASSGVAAHPSTVQVRLSLDLQQMEWMGEGVGRIMRLAGSGVSARGTEAHGRSNAAGRRALRLPPSEAWSPFTLSSLSTLGAMGMRANAGSTVVPIPLIQDPAGSGPSHVPSGSVALESSMGVAGGWRCEVLRSMCTLHNTTSLTLQVSLLYGSEAATWTLIPHTSGGSVSSSAGTPTAPNSSGATGTSAYEVVEEEVFENERFVPLKGWCSSTPSSSSSAAGSDRNRYNRNRVAGQDYHAFPQVVLPPSETSGARWDWEGPWEVEMVGHVDSDGWAYGSSWPAVVYPFKPGCGMRRPTDLVRRRRWVRRRRCMPPASTTAAGVTADGAVRKVLGMLEPGGALPLPLGWSVEGCELQVRPVLEDPRMKSHDEVEDTAFPDGDQELQGAGSSAFGRPPAPLLLGQEGEVLHSWSVGTAGGGGVAAVDLSMIEDGGTRLLSCGCTGAAAEAVLQRPPHPPGAGSGSEGGGGGEASALLSQMLQPFWLSVAMECDPLLITQGNVDNSLDWRLAVRPPLLVHNQLPLAAQYVVWERPGGPSAPLRARQQGRLDPGASAPCYTADMRQQILLTFCPDGCEYGESEPVLLSEGIMSRSLAGVAGSPRLPDSFRCTYTHSRAEGMAMRVHLVRELETPGADGLSPEGAGPQVSAASLMGGPFTFSTGATAAPRARNAVAEGVARGLPLAVRLYAPLVVLNATQLPISVGLLQVEVTESSQSGEGGGEASGVSMFGAPARSTMSPPSGMGIEGLSSPMGASRVIDTDAFTSSPKPPAHVTLPPRAVEVLPLPALTQPEGGVVVQAAVALSIAGSRWSAPLPVAGPGGPPVRTASSPNPLDPVLIRARGRADGTLHEVVVRLEVASSAPEASPLVAGAAGGMGSSSGTGWQPGSTVTGMGMAAMAGRVSMVLHIEPHVVVVNRTGFTLNVVQPESMMLGGMASSTPSTPLASGAGASNNFTGGVASLAANASAQGARPAVLTVHAGVVGLALQWHPSCSRRLLCLSMPGAAEGGELLLSEPFKLDALGVGVDTQVALPLARTHTRDAVAPHTASGASGDAAGGGAAGALPNSLTRRRVTGADEGTQGGATPPPLAPGASPNLSPHHTSAGSSSAPFVLPGDAAYEATAQRARHLLAAAAGGYGTAAPGHNTDGSPPEVPGLCVLRVVRRDTQQGSTGQEMEGQYGPHRAEYASVVVVMSVVPRVPGCYALVFSSLGAEPAVLLHNATHHGVRYRELAARGIWHTLGPFSADGYVRQALLGPALVGGVYAQQAAAVAGGSALGPLELELKDDAAEATGGTVYISFDPSGDGPGDTGSVQPATPRAGSASGTSAAGPGLAAASGTAVLRLGPERADCMAQVTDGLECILTPSGLAFVDGGSTRSVALGGGGCRADRVMRLVPRPPAAVMGPNGLRATGPRMLVLTPDLVSGGTASSMHVAIEVSGLEVSLVDGRPQELVLLTLEGLSAEYHAGNTAGVAYVQTSLKMRNLQVDDQLPGTPHPVVLLPLDANRQDGPGAEPLVAVTYTAEPGRRRGVLYCPCIAARVAPLRLALGEALLWRIFNFAHALGNAASLGAAGGVGTASSSRAAATAAAAHRQGAEHQQVVADLPLAIDLFNIEDVELRISFKADAAVRPRFANQALSLGLDLANLEDLPLVLPGMELERARVHQAALVQMMVARLQQKVFGIAISVLRNSGVLGSTSKILAAASHGVASLTEVRTGTGREVGNLGEGMLEGGRELARGLLAGALGIVSKPVQGAERGGVAGFLGGVAKGIVGAAVNPVSGALAAASKVTEGMDATYGRVRESVFSAPRRSGRKRLPRPFTGDRVLRPFSLHHALGQALLHTASLPTATASVLTLGLDRRLLGRLNGTGSSAAAAAAGAVFSGDAYEEHYLLPGGRVMLITDKRLALLNAPEFVSLQSAAMGGDVTHVTEVPPSTILWELGWGGILTAELAWHQQQPGLPPDGVLVHRKRRSAQDELVYDVRCRPNSHQAQELLAAINAARYRQLALRQELALWRDRRALRSDPSQAPAVVAGDGQTRPDTLPSCDWQLVWYCTSTSRPPGLSARAASPSMSIWRPLGPPGYARLGDVALAGVQPPSEPVRMYKDLSLSDGDAPGEGPRLVAPVGYALLFRDAAFPPITLWRPVPPRGYQEVGCVAWPEIEEPPLGLVRCVRRDLLRPATPGTAPLWASSSSDNKFWRVGVWPLDDSPAGTFVALKGDARPLVHQAAAPMY